MTKRLWLNLLLLIVGAVLVYVIWYQPSKPVTSHEALFTTAPYQANDILIRRQGKPDIQFVKTAEQWQLIQPAIAPINEEKIKHLLTILQEPVIASYDLSGKDLTQFGLNPGKIKLTINAEEITFGSTNPVTLNRYILKNNTVYTIKEIVYGVLGSSVTPFLKHHLLPQHSEVLAVEAPAMFDSITVNTWQTFEATDIADYSGDETIVGKIKLTISNKSVNANNEADKHLIELDILAIKPLIVLGRPDLGVEYTFDQTIINNKQEKQE